MRGKREGYKTNKMDSLLSLPASNNSRDKYEDYSSQPSKQAKYNEVLKGNI